MFSKFSEVAASQPEFAWIPEVRSPEEIATATPSNRWIGFPCERCTGPPLLLSLSARRSLLPAAMVSARSVPGPVSAVLSLPSDRVLLPGRHEVHERERQHRWRSLLAHVLRRHCQAPRHPGGEVGLPAQRSALPRGHGAGEICTATEMGPPEVKTANRLLPTWRAVNSSIPFFTRRVKSSHRGMLSA